MLRELLELESLNFTEFARDFSEIHENLDQACQKLIEIGFYLNDHLIADTQFPAFGSLLLAIHRILAVSALRFVTRDYDEGMVLLRMACEQSRDLCALIKNPLLFFLWKRYRTNRASLEKDDWDKFRREFKFDVSSETGKSSKWVYDHTSEVGCSRSWNSFKSLQEIASNRITSSTKAPIYRTYVHTSNVSR